MAAALLQWRACALRNPNFCPGWRGAGGGGGVWPSCTGGVLLHRLTTLPQWQRVTDCHRKEKSQFWCSYLREGWKISRTWWSSRSGVTAGASCGSSSSSSSNSWEKWQDTSSSRVHNKSIISTGGPGLCFLLLPWCTNLSVTTSSTTTWRRGGVATVEQQPQQQQQQHYVADEEFRAPRPLPAQDNLKESEQEMRALLSTGDLDGALDILLQQQPGRFSSAGAYSALLSACSKRKALGAATRLSAHMSAAGLLDCTSASPALGEQLVSTLVQCGGLEAALHVFHRLPATTAFSWTAVISGYAAAGAPRAALRTYRRMLLLHEAGTTTTLRPNSYTFVSALKACGALGDLAAGRAVHADVARAGAGALASDPFVGAALVDMYAKCSGADAARGALEALPRPAVSVVAWNAVLAACVREGRPRDAVDAYGRMRTGTGGGVSPSDRTVVSAAQACGMLAEAESQRREHWAGVGRGVHADARRRGWDTRDVFVGCTLISMYGKCGALRDAQAVFAGLTTAAGAGAGQRRQVDAVAWNAMLAAYVHLGRAEAALALYRDGVASGALASPDDRTLACVVQACAAVAEADPGRREWVLEQGAAVHAECKRRGGLDARSVFVGNALITMYARCGSLAAAEAAFAGLEPRCRDVVSWSAVMAACAGLGRPARALELYDQMMLLRESSGGGVSPNARTLVSAIQACGALAEEEVDGDDDDDDGGGTITAAAALERGRRVHADARRRGWDARDVFVGNALVSMYGKCGAVGDAAAVFRGMLARDLVSWNAMMAAHADAGDALACLRLYDQVVALAAAAAASSGSPAAIIAPDARTFAVAAQACGVLADSSSDDATATTAAALARTRSVHAAAEAAGLAESLYVGTALVTAYAKCGALPAAESAFSTTLSAAATTSDAALWNAMLSGYLHLSRPDLALTLHQSHPHHPADAVTHLCVLAAAGATGTLSLCRRAHAALLRLHAALPSTTLATALVHAYGRCGSMPDAQAAFDALPPGRRHPATATALVAGYARAGCHQAALTVYRAMPRPDGVALAAVLAACAHAGMVAQGVQAFTEACCGSASGGGGGGRVAVEQRHVAGLVDLVARAGHLTLARQLAESAVAGDPGGGRGEEWASVWLSVLGACRTRCGGGEGKEEQEEAVATARWAFARAVAAGPRESAAYVLMAGVCVEAGRWEEAREVRRMRRAAGAVKAQGRSWVHVEGAGGVEGGVVGFASGEGVPLEVGAVLGQLRALVGDDDKLLVTGLQGVHT